MMHEQRGELRRRRHDAPEPQRIHRLAQQQQDYMERFQAAQRLRHQEQQQQQQQRNNGSGESPQRRSHSRNLSRSTWYGIISTLVAILAIVLTPIHHQPLTDFASSSLQDMIMLPETRWFQSLGLWKSHADEAITAPMATPSPNHKQHQSSSSSSNKLPHWLRWMNNNDSDEHEQGLHARYKTRWKSLDAILHHLISWMDPILLQEPWSSTTVTDLLDKILTSTFRLIAIANFLLACTFFTHATVADWFLGSRGGESTNHHSPNPAAAAATTNNNTLNTDSNINSRGGVAGYLLFKMLLMSAIVSPDILDLLILLGWYTLLAFLRSLAHQCHLATVQLQQQQTTVQPAVGGVNGNSNSSTTMLRMGILQLLLLILVSDLLAASTCVALFHGAGWGMVLLLTCDNALLLLDVLGYMLQFVAHMWEQAHSVKVQECEQALSQRLRRERRESNNLQNMSDSQARHVGGMRRVESIRESVFENDSDENDDIQYEDLVAPISGEAEAEVRNLERQLEVMEQVHAKQLSRLDSAVFILQIIAQLLTIGHFVHIWMLHGVQFTPINGVIALHLYAAVTQASRKITDRRKLHRIARELNSRFDDATDMELRKAAAAGDVCCICLTSMNSTTQVKRVGCGHLYHTSCLREVVERARSLESARCPLCRANVLDGQQPQHVAGVLNRTGTQTREQVEAGAAASLVQATAAEELQAMNDAPAGRENERALLRFSTENFIPAWLPLPAFSFEVVSRQVPEPADAANFGAQGQHLDAAAHEDPPRLSFLRRLLILAGAIPMSAEEEAAALEQLVDMFPQYDRAELARELRSRRSIEAVAERILAGTFGGEVRAGAIPANNIQAR
ncbi:hypothetical protein MPSEU_000156700 [Mayamaea pseudoterrestris]|nr:hypothetical protein MPSEU_000156700 [Mayamaea pseudoterrestris]